MTSLARTGGACMGKRAKLGPRGRSTTGLAAISMARAGGHPVWRENIGPRGSVQGAWKVFSLARAGEARMLWHEDWPARARELCTRIDFGPRGLHDIPAKRVASTQISSRKTFPVFRIAAAI